MLCQFYSGTVFLYICVYVTVLFIIEEEEKEEEDVASWQVQVFFLLRIFCTFELSCHLLCLVIFSRFVLVFSICVLLCKKKKKKKKKIPKSCKFLFQIQTQSFLQFICFVYGFLVPLFCVHTRYFPWPCYPLLMIHFALYCLLKDPLWGYFSHLWS